MSKILVGDCRVTLRDLEPGTVDCIVTSPPYWNLRDYGGKANQIGMEATPQEFVANMVDVFDSCYSVLANHGTLWLNLGDSFAATSKHRTVDQSTKNSTLSGGLKQKDMAGIPWMVAFALREFGWYLRSEIVWHKPNPMPSSVKDRPTTSHEQIFLLTKSPRYYYDWFAISEETTWKGKSNWKNKRTEARAGNRTGGGNEMNGVTYDSNMYPRRNKRSVWKVSTKGYKGAHFATFPPKLIEPCVLAGCPEKVCCGCGKPWERQVTKERRPSRPGNQTKVGRVSDDIDSPYHAHSGAILGNRDPQRHVTEYHDQGMFPQCECEAPTRQGLVLDPFLGSGTTAAVAQSCGRDWMGCELNEDYLPLVWDRLKQLRLPF